MKKGIVLTILGILVVAGLAWFLGLMPSAETDPTASLEKELDSLQVEDLNQELQGIEAELENL